MIERVEEMKETENHAVIDESSTPIPVSPMFEEKHTG